MDKEERPWGYFKVYFRSKSFVTKLLHVNAGQMLSSQYHKHRSELWLILNRNMDVEIGKRNLKGKLGFVFIPKMKEHRLGSRKGGSVLEFSFGRVDEKDVVRIRDKYGRK